jgi:hypothetical protein
MQNTFNTLRTHSYLQEEHVNMARMYPLTNACEKTYVKNSYINLFTVSVSLSFLQTFIFLRISLSFFSLDIRRQVKEKTSNFNFWNSLFIEKDSISFEQDMAATQVLHFQLSWFFLQQLSRLNEPLSRLNKISLITKKSKFWRQFFIDTCLIQTNLVLLNFP